jgi:hypothetical protein
MAEGLERAMTTMGPSSEAVEAAAPSCSDDCSAPAAYVVTLEEGGGSWPLCTSHTALMRANDPLEFIESVRSIRGEVSR